MWEKKESGRIGKEKKSPRKECGACETRKNPTYYIVYYTSMLP